jgi:phenylacetic acid degradation operon negative regulatory protein
MQNFASPEAKFCIVFRMLSGQVVAMKPKTEDFLYLLLWSADVLMRPTFRNLTDSFEGWAYRNGLSRQVATLEQLRLLERDQKATGDRLYRLTEQGRLHALGGRDPAAQWSRHWDGRWRLVLFDVPMEQHVHRGRLRRYLHAKGFGCLQGSVWITPDPVHGERQILAGGKINVESLLLLEARPCSGESDVEIAAGAWDFGNINNHYARHLKLLDQRPDGSLRNNAAAKALQRWAADERAAWHAAVEIDPLLPKRLLPPDYLGCRAWQRRIEVLRQAGQQLQTFRG